MYQTCKLPFFLAAMMVIVCGPVWAHNVAVFAWVEGDMVYVEGKFGSGRRPVNAPVKIYDPEENLLLEGITDEKGAFSFKVPGRVEMKVVLEAGMGHRGEWTIPLSDLEDVGVGDAIADISADSGTAREIEMAPMVKNSTMQGHQQAPVSDGYVTSDELQEVVEAALDKKLKPVMKVLAEAQQSGPSVTDILGGIGYIFGLVGVAAYFNARRKGKTK